MTCAGAAVVEAESDQVTALTVTPGRTQTWGSGYALSYSQSHQKVVLNITDTSFRGNALNGAGEGPSPQRV